MSSLTICVDGGVGRRGSRLMAEELLTDTNCEGMWSPSVTGPVVALWLFPLREEGALFDGCL